MTYLETKTVVNVLGKVISESFASRNHSVQSLASKYLFCENFSLGIYIPDPPAIIH